MITLLALAYAAILAGRWWIIRIIVIHAAAVIPGLKTGRPKLLSAVCEPGAGRTGSAGVCLSWLTTVEFESVSTFGAFGPWLAVPIPTPIGPLPHTSKRMPSPVIVQNSITFIKCTHRVPLADGAVRIDRLFTRVLQGHTSGNLEQTAASPQSRDPFHFILLVKTA